jgi:hypothetical protein
MLLGARTFFIPRFFPGFLQTEAVFQNAMKFSALRLSLFSGFFDSTHAQQVFVSSLSALRRQRFFVLFVKKDIKRTK